MLLIWLYQGDHRGHGGRTSGSRYKENKERFKLVIKKNVQTVRRRSRGQRAHVVCVLADFQLQAG